MSYLVNTIEINVLIERNMESAAEEIKAHFLMKKIDVRMRIIYKI